MSWVFLTNEWAYKLKKPVRYDFLDFTTLDRRHRDCLREVRLNRRLAERVYLGVVPLKLLADGRLSLAEEGYPVEWLVKMLRLPRERMLDIAIEQQTVTVEDVRRFTQVLAAFYHRALPVEMAPQDYVRRFSDDIRAHRRELGDDRYQLGSMGVDGICGRLLEFTQRDSALLEERATAKRIVEGHGDLRPEHVALLHPPVFIDCIEFKREFRLLDTAAELAFLAMECEMLDADFVGEAVFQVYRDCSGDNPPPKLVLFYKAERALLRAKLSIWHIKDHEVAEHAKWDAKCKAYLSLAARYCDQLTSS